MTSYPSMSFPQAIYSLKKANYITVDSILNSLEFFYFFDNNLRFEIESSLFMKFEISNIFIKKKIVKFFKNFEESAIEHFNDSVSPEFNILNYINSFDPKLKSVGLRFVKCFYSYYEFDEIVIFHIRKFKTFRKLLGRNEKYRILFKIKAEDDRKIITSTKKNSFSDSRVLNNQFISEAEKSFLTKLFNCTDLKNLQEFLLSINTLESPKIQLIIQVIVNACEGNEKTEIPGIVDALFSKSSEIDPFFELKISGEDKSGLYLAMDHVLRKLTNS